MLARDLNATVGAQERDKRNTCVGNRNGEDMNEVRDNEDLALRPGMVALASAIGYPHCPCVVDRVFRANDVSVPLKDAAANWAYCLNRYIAEVAKHET